MSVVYGTPNLERGGTYEITGFSWAELAAYLEDAWYGPVPPTAVFMHHTYRPVAAANISLVDTVKLTAGILRYFFNQGWRPFGRGPHLFCSPAGGVLAWPVSRDGYHVTWHNERTLGVEFMYDGEVGPAPKWAIDGWIRICRALSRSAARIPRDRQHMRLHRDYTAGGINDQAARAIDLAGADFSRFPTRKTCPGRRVLEAHIYPPLWAALTPGSPAVPEDDVDAQPRTFHPRTGRITLDAGARYNAFRFLGLDDKGQPLLRRYNDVSYSGGSVVDAIGLAHWQAGQPESGCYLVSPFAYLSGTTGTVPLVWWSRAPLPAPKVAWSSTSDDSAAVRTDAANRLDRLSRQAAADADAMREP